MKAERCCGRAGGVVRSPKYSSIVPQACTSTATETAVQVVKNCFTHAQFIVPAQEIHPSKVNSDEETADDSDCEALLAKVLERQSGIDRVPFSAFFDVDNDVET